MRGLVSPVCCCGRLLRAVQARELLLGAVYLSDTVSHAHMMGCHLLLQCHAQQLCQSPAVQALPMAMSKALPKAFAV